MILDEIRAIERRQDEQQNHLQKKTEEFQGNELRFQKARGSVKS